MKNTLRLAGLGLVLLLAGCETVPETARSRVLLVSASQETSMGLSAFEEIKQK